jgi:nucleoid-associated protein YgaU
MQLTGVPGVVAPSFIDDTIRAGDTFASIAQRHYGDASRADVIARANPLMSPLNLREGRTIRVPNDPANVQGLPVVKLADGSTQTAPAQQPANAAPAQEYVVQKGDSLARIAKRVFGEERLADMIFQANRDVLSDPSKIRVGQKLKIPPKPVTDIATAGDGT